MVDRVELLPCPFCGAPAGLTKGLSAILCTSCLAEGPATTPEGIAILWNTRTPAEPLADGEMIEKLVREAYEEGVEDGMEHASDPTDGVPQWIDSVARIEMLRAIAAYNPNDRLREALERARAALELALSMHKRARDTVPDEEEGLAAEVFCHHINLTDGPIIEAMSMIDVALSHKD